MKPPLHGLFAYMPSTFASLSKPARAYVALVVCAGTATIAHSLYTLIQQPIGWSWLILAVLTLVSGSATIRLPSLPATISVSEDIRIHVSSVIWLGRRNDDSSARRTGNLTLGV